MKQPTKEDKRRLKAYKWAKDDQVAADRLGIRKNTFKSWRRKNELPAKTPQGRPQVTGKAS